MSAVSFLEKQYQDQEWKKVKGYGFVARPVVMENGERNLLEWECGVPGKKQTSWEGAGGLYKVKLTFDEGYPLTPPTCRFEPPIYHPNVFPSGTLNLALVYGVWRSDMTISKILKGIQELLSEPKIDDPANAAAFSSYVASRRAYELEVKAQALRTPCVL